MSLLNKISHEKYGQIESKEQETLSYKEHSVSMNNGWNENKQMEDKYVVKM